MKLRKSRVGFRQDIAICVASLVVLTSVTFLLTRTAHAFKPTEKLKSVATDQSHESMTVSTIADLDMNEFFPELFVDTHKLNSTMENAAKQVAAGNAQNDLRVIYFFSPSRHFDDESFSRSQKLVSDLLQEMKRALEKEDTDSVKTARTKLGQALHVVQDFYSHSNWVELGNNVPSPIVGRGGTISPVAGPTEPTCQSCTPCPNCAGNIITNKITTGYFSLNPLNRKPAGKCSHGGTGDFSASDPPQGGINKDSSLCSASPHYPLHQTAANIAKEATKLILRDVKNMVTLRQLKLLLGVGPTLAFCIDTTGSMDEEIESVKQQVTRIVDTRLGTVEEPSKYILVAFNDPDVGLVTATSDANNFKLKLNALSADGGGDCPELTFSGIKLAVEASDEKSEVIVFTDASSKDSDLAGFVRAAAIIKGVKITYGLTGSCSPVDPAFIDIASSTGGQVFLLSESEVEEFTRIADFLVRSDAVDLLSVTTALNGVAKTYTVPIDSSMLQTTFSVSGTSNVILKRPNGSTVLPSDPDVSLVQLATGAIYSIASPTPGTWTLIINGSGTASLRVTGQGDLRFSSVDFVKLAGWPDHEGFTAIAGFPLVGQVSKMDAYLSIQQVNTANFELRTKEGVVLQSLSLTEVPRVDNVLKEFIGDVGIPSTPFLVYVTGQDSNGNAYQRVLPTLIEPQTVRIDSPDGRLLRPGQVGTFSFQVTNLGPANVFQLSASDQVGSLIGITPTTISLANNQTSTVTITVQPPVTAEPGAIDDLTVAVEGSLGARNFAVVNNEIATESMADLSVTKVASPGFVLVGKNLTFTITVTNNGPDEATDVSVIDHLPATISLVSCSASGDGVCGGSGNDVSVIFTSIAANTSATITLVATVNSSAANSNSLSNTAVVSSSSEDPDQANNSATTTVAVFNFCLEDDSSRSTLVFNSVTGSYIFCCSGGFTITGTGVVTNHGSTYTLTQGPFETDRRILAQLDTSVNRGTASVQFPPGTTVCTITDRDIRNNSGSCP